MASFAVEGSESLWTKDPLTSIYYQINSKAALTWHQARKSCQQQDAELLSITEIHEQTYLTGNDVTWKHSCEVMTVVFLCMCTGSVTQLCPTLCDPVDCQTPLSLEFSSQEYWSGLQFNLKAESTSNYRYHDRVNPKQMVQRAWKMWTL